MTFQRSIALFLLLIIFADCKNPKSNTPMDSNKKKKFVSLVPPDSTGTLMSEDDFWKIIDQSRTAANDNYQQQIKALKNILMSLEPKGIEQFNNTFTALSAASYDWKLWGASYVINGGCSDDCFDYFRQYLIAQGKDKFYEMLDDPENCAEWVRSESNENWEGIQYAAYDAYKEKAGKEIPNSYLPKFELKGKPFDEATVNKQYPKLAEKFGGLF